MRNLQAALSREEAALALAEGAFDDVDAVRAELAVLEELQRIDEPRLSALNDTLATTEAEQQRARLRALQAEAAHESAYRDLERRQLIAIESAFPTAGETARYLLSRLFSDSQCLACGNPAPEAAAELHARVLDGSCVVCGTTLEQPTGTKSIVSRAINKSIATLAAAEEQLAAETVERQAADAALEALLMDIQEITATIASRRARIAMLLRQLPPDEAEVHAQRAELASLGARVAMQKVELAEQRAAFADYVKAVNRDIAARKDAIKSEFDRFAEGFLLEECDLLWSPQKARVGESGEQIEFAAFELDMTGASFSSPVRRSGPEQVSESQREFIDLAFRMTLMEVAAEDLGGTLVIDAPESSLDAVFVSRAATVLSRFGDPETTNRLIITSNLIEGDLVPELLRLARIRSASDRRVIDLLKVAAPTAATSRLKTEYRRVRSSLFRRARGGRA